MPDDPDYAWLKWLVEHPQEWSLDDLATAKQILATQRQALAEEHPRDERGRESKQRLVDELERAIKKSGG